MGRFKTFLYIPASRKLLLCEAFAMLVWGWFVIRCLSFRRYAERLGEPSAGENYDDNVQDEYQLRNIRWAIDAINRLFGGKFNCLMQGIAGKLMLNRRGISNTLVLGTRITRENGDRNSETLKAHAWLWAGQVIILGGEVRNEYTPITSYHSE
jgi:hypothetical protein